MKSAIVSALILIFVIVSVVVNSCKTHDFLDKAEAELSMLGLYASNPGMSRKIAENLDVMWSKELPRLLVTTNKTCLLNAGDAFDRLLVSADEPWSIEYKVARKQLELAFHYIRSFESFSRVLG